MRKYFITLIAILLLALSTSCLKFHIYSDQYTGQIPGSENSYQMADGVYYPRGLTATAIKIFYTEWKTLHKDQEEQKKVYEALNNIRILWIDNGNNETFSDCDVRLYGQVSLNENVIKISVRHDKSIAATSLSHELVHIANHAINGHFDYDHSEGEDKGWNEKHDALIEKVNQKIRKAEKEFNKKRKALTKALESGKVPEK